MKKWWVLLLVLLMAVCACAGAEEEAYKLFVDEHGILNHYEGILPSELIIPDEIDGAKVYSIGNGVFSNSSITSVVLPEGIDILGEYAFAWCEQLTSVTLPSTLKSISEGAFYSSSIKKINLPKYLEYIGEEAFCWCAQLESITLPASLYDIKDDAFAACEKLTFRCYKDSYAAQWVADRLLAHTLLNADGSEIPAPYTLLTDDYGNIIGYTGTPVDVVIPYTLNGMVVEYIAEYAFSGCTSLNSVTFHKDNWGGIGEGAFRDCVNLTKVNMSDGMQTIAAYAFAGCTSLEKVNLPKNLMYIERNAFQNTKVTDITIGARLSLIEASAFLNCPLQSITFLGVTLPDIATNAFWPDGVQTSPCTIRCYRDSNVEAWSLEKDYPVEYLAESNTYELHMDENGFIWGFTGTPTHVVIPNEIDGIKVVGIDECAFCEILSLRSVSLPEGLTTISNSAFSGCYNLAKVNIPSTVTTIGKFAFNDCRALEGDLVIPEGVTVIKYGSFWNCSNVRSITLPEGLTHIEGSAFNRCYGLTSVTIPDSVTKIDEFAFYLCTGLKEITLSASLTHIGEEAFGDCTSLANVTIPNGTTVIHSRAFSWCSGLKTITIPVSVETIGEDAFSGCHNLTICCYKGTAADIYAQANSIPVKYLDESSDNEGDDDEDPGVTSTVTLPASLVIIGEEAFLNSHVDEFILPDGCTTVGSRAFAGSSVKLIHIPASVTGIAADAFEDCSNVTFVTPAGSAAEAFAQAHGIPVMTEDCDPNPVPSPRL